MNYFYRIKNELLFMRYCFLLEFRCIFNFDGGSGLCELSKFVTKFNSFGCITSYLIELVLEWKKFDLSFVIIYKEHVVVSLKVQNLFLLFVQKNAYSTFKKIYIFFKSKVFFQIQE